MPIIYIANDKLINDSTISFRLQLVTVSDAVSLLQQFKRPSDRSTIEVIVLVTLKHEVMIFL